MAGSTITYVTQSELNSKDPGVKQLDPAVRHALFNTLDNDGVYSVPKERAWLQEGDLQGHPQVSYAQILETTTNASITTDAALKAIIINDQGGAGHTLDVSGGNDEFIALGSGGDTLTLHDSGNDTVFGGKGNDSIDASGSTGNDSLVGGGGNDTIWGGSGHDTLDGGAGKDQLHSGSVSGGFNILHGNGGDDTLYGGAGADSLYGGAGHDSLVGGTGSSQLLQSIGGYDTLVAGSGSGQLLKGGGGHDSISDNNSSLTPHDTLIGSGGNDTITGQQGDVLRDDGPKGSQNQFWLYGNSGASSTLQGGAGDDTFHIETNSGDDTIKGGGGNNVIDFDKLASTDEVGAPHQNTDGSWTLVFNGGQQHVTVSGIADIHFTDNVDLKLS
jgi:Ca2+-binding RTX toxin-like protein